MSVLDVYGIFFVQASSLLFVLSLSLSLSLSCIIELPEPVLTV